MESELSNKPTRRRSKKRKLSKRRRTGEETLTPLKIFSFSSSSIVSQETNTPFSFCICVTSLYFVGLSSISEFSFLILFFFPYRIRDLIFVGRNVIFGDFIHLWKKKREKDFVWKRAEALLSL